MHLSVLLQFALTALLGSMIYFHASKLNSLKYPPNMLTFIVNEDHAKNDFHYHHY